MNGYIQIVVHTHNGKSFNPEKERSTDTCYVHEPRNHTLSEKGQTQKITCGVIPFIRNIQNRQTTGRSRKSSGGSQEGEWRSNSLLSTAGFPFGVTKMFWE